MVSEAAIHTSIARTRAGRGAAIALDEGTIRAAPDEGTIRAAPDEGSVRAAPDERAVRAALGAVPDPEIPVVSIVELGMVEDVRVDTDGIHVSLLPTFVGCPAQHMIRSSVERRLSGFGRPVDVRFEYRVPWSSDRISPDGRAKLLESGFAPPAPVRADEPLLVQLDRPVPCPSCGSRRTVLENLFGPTQCRAIYHCTACRQPFESFKSI